MHYIFIAKLIDATNLLNKSEWNTKIFIGYFYSPPPQKQINFSWVQAWDFYDFPMKKKSESYFLIEDHLLPVGFTLEFSPGVVATPSLSPVGGACFSESPSFAVLDERPSVFVPNMAICNIKKHNQNFLIVHTNRSCIPLNLLLLLFYIDVWIIQIKTT